VVFFVLMVIGQFLLTESSLIRALGYGLVCGVLFAAVQYWSVRREGSLSQ